GSPRKLEREQQVFRLTPVNVGGQADAIVEDGGVEADVDLLTPLPPEIGVLQSGENPPRRHDPVEDVVAAVYHPKRWIVADLVVAGISEGEAQLRFVQPVHIAKELLLRH